MPFYPHGNFVNVRPSDPSAITNAAYKMAGLGVAGASAWVLTPQTSCRILLLATGMQTAGATAVTCTLQLAFGTGAAPANAGTAAGTQQGNQPAWISLTGTVSAPFCLWTIVPTQVAGVALWFDIAQKSSSSTLTLQTLELIAIEI